MIQVSQQTELSAGPDLTALIDIVFIVVVFLLLTANTSLLSLPVDVPNTDSKIDTLLAEKQQLLVSIKPTKPYWSIRFDSPNSADSNTINNSETYYESWENAKSALLSFTQHKNTHLLIATDKDANANRLLQLLAFLNEQELNNTQILMEAQ